jgi:hypothetical protein
MSRSHEGHYGTRHTALWSCTHTPNIIDLSGKTKKLWSGKASLRRSRRRRSGRRPKIRLKQYVSLRSKGRHNNSGMAKVKTVKNERDPTLFTGKLLIKFQKILRNTTQVIIRHRVKILFSVISSPITLERHKCKSSKMKGILLSSPVNCW